MDKFKLLMFVDDDEATNLFHEVVVEESNLCEQQLFFESPKEALKHLEEGNSDTEFMPPDVIFLDLNMPELTGWEFLDAYHKDLKADFPIVILLTTSIRDYDRERAEKHPKIKKMINKPLTEEKLKEILDLISASKEPVSG